MVLEQLLMGFAKKKMTDLRATQIPVSRRTGMGNTNQWFHSACSLIRSATVFPNYCRIQSVIPKSTKYPSCTVSDLHNSPVFPKHIKQKLIFAPFPEHAVLGRIVPTRRLSLSERRAACLFVSQCHGFTQRAQKKKHAKDKKHITEPPEEQIALVQNATFLQRKDH